MESILTRKKSGTLENKNKQVDQGYKSGNIIKFRKSTQLKCYGDAGRMQNGRMPSQITTATMEGKRKIGRPSKRCRFEFEEDLNIMGIKNKQVKVRDLRECRRISLEVKVHNGL